MAEKCFDAIDIFEQQDTVGGAWNYSENVPNETHCGSQVDPFQPLEQPKVVVHAEKTRLEFFTPMYERLETNIPKSIMTFSDKDFPADSQLFPQRELVSKYLEDYSDDVRHLINFQTQVQEISLQSSISEKDSWLVLTKDLVTGETKRMVYDAVAVANGHYTVPYVPNIAGINAWGKAYPGILSHSKFYRRPEEFRGKKVVIVGNNASGTDIGHQISLLCKSPVICSAKSESMLLLPTGLEQVNEIVEFLAPQHGARAVRLSDGRVEDNIDAVIFCTGYLYSLPFMPSLQPQIITNGFRIKHVFQHVFYIDHPSLAFLALPMKVVPFPLSEDQASVISGVWSERLKLPSKAEMCSWEDERIKNADDGKGFHALPFPQDLEYQNMLYDWATSAAYSTGKTPPRWGEREKWTRKQFPAIKKAFAEKGKKRHGIKDMNELGFVFET